MACLIYTAKEFLSYRKFLECNKVVACQSTLILANDHVLSTPKVKADFDFFVRCKETLENQFRSKMQSYAFGEKKWLYKFIVHCELFFPEKAGRVTEQLI